MSAAAPREEDIHAYADDQLAPDDAARVAAAIERDAALAHRVAEIRRQNAALRSAMDAWLVEPLSPRLLEAITADRAQRPPSRLRLLLAAAASLVLGLALGWYGKGEMIAVSGTPVTFERQAALTHALYATDANRPVEVWANEEQRLVTWLTKRLGVPVHVPDLKSAGFSLVGGRLVAGNENPAGMFVYENASRQRISLLVRKDKGPGGETGFHYAVENGIGVYYWIDDAFGYALSGNLDKAQLLSIGRIVYGQLAAFEAAAQK